MRRDRRGRVTGRRVPQLIEEPEIQEPALIEEPASIEEPVEIAAGIELDPTNDADSPDETPIAAEIPIAEDADTGEKGVPFYKREISFRRKPADSVESSDAAEHDGDVIEFPAQGAVDEAAVEPAEPELEPVAAEVEADEPEALDLEPAAVAATAWATPETASQPIEDFEFTPAETVSESTEAVETAAEAVAEAGERPAVGFARRRRGQRRLPRRWISQTRRIGLRSPLPTPIRLRTRRPRSRPMIPQQPCRFRRTCLREPVGDCRGGRSEPRSARSAAAASSTKGRRVVGLKIGASQIAAAVVIESETGHELVQLARTPARLRDRRRRRGTRPGRARERAQVVLRRGEAAQEGCSHRPCEQPDRRSHVRHRRHRRRGAVRQRRSLQGPRGSAGRRSRVVARLPGARGASQRGRRADATRPARRRAAGSGRAVPTRCRSRGPQARRDRPRGARPAAGVRRAAGRSRPVPPTIRRRSSSRSGTSRRRCSSPAAAPVSSPASSTGAAARS